jgi:hypothetical protein
MKKQMQKLHYKLKTLLYARKKYEQFGSQIVALYTYNNLLVVATKLDVFVSEDGVHYEKVVVSGN